MLFWGSWSSCWVCVVLWGGGVCAVIFLSTPSPTDLDWTVRLDWSLTIWNKIMVSWLGLSWVSKNRGLATTISLILLIMVCCFVLILSVKFHALSNTTMEAGVKNLARKSPTFVKILKNQEVLLTLYVRRMKYRRNSLPGRSFQSQADQEKVASRIMGWQ